jgi:c-di-GMP-binding flagellar brake protein YcgR
MGSDIEKRRHHRQRAGLEVAIVPHAGEELPADLRLITSDIALEGMHCASNVPLEPGTEMHLKLSLVGGDISGSETIDVAGKVLRCSVREGSPDVRRHGIAITFVTITPQDRKKLQRYLNSL